MAEILSQPALHYPPPSQPQSDKHLTFHTLLAQLKSRNCHNALIIKKFMRKVHKNRNFLQDIIDKPKRVELSEELNEPIQTETIQEIFQQQPKFHSQQHCLPTNFDPTLKDSLLFKTADTNHDTQHEEPEPAAPPQRKIHPFGRQKQQKYNLLTPTIKNETHLDPNFANYLKNVYVKELLEKAKERKLKSKLQPKKQTQTCSQEQSKFLNVKSLVFGSQDLSGTVNLQDLPVKINRVSTEGNNNASQGSIQQIHKITRGTAGYKLCNNFLPSISRHFGKIKKRDLINLQSRLKIGDQCSKNIGLEQYGYDLSEIDSMERIGISFRINTLQIKKHY